MENINIQKKTSAERGKIELYWFENENIELKKTLFHRIYIPLKPFNSGLDYESQPVDTVIVIEWLNLNLDIPTELDGLNIKSSKEDETEISIYIGSAHNPCDIKKMNLKKIEDNVYQVDCELFIEFEYENVAQNEEFSFVTQLELDTEIKE